LQYPVPDETELLSEASDLSAGGGWGAPLATVELHPGAAMTEVVLYYHYYEYLLLLEFIQPPSCSILPEQ